MAAAVSAVPRAALGVQLRLASRRSPVSSSPSAGVGVKRRHHASPVLCAATGQQQKNQQDEDGKEADPDVRKRLPASSRIILGDDKRGQLDVCRVVNGMWQLSGGWGLIEHAKAVKSMVQHVDTGFTSFDLADIYGPAEDIYGIFYNELLRTRGEEVALNVQGLTKYVPVPQRMTRAVVEQAINKSRKRMGVKALDSIQFHWWDYADSSYIDALLHLTDLKEEGKITTVALTNFDTERLEIILDKGIPVVSNQASSQAAVQCSLVDQRPLKLMAGLCEEKGVKLITYGSVLGGLLSEKYLNSKEPGSFMGPKLTTPSLSKYKRMVDAWGGWALFQQLLQECNSIAKKHGVSVSAVGVRWVLQQQAVGASMIGARFGLSDHADQNKELFNFEMDAEDMSRLDSVQSKSKDLLALIGDCGDEYR
eukprot:jgi/Chlat1/5854/Chrsp4S06233